MPYIQPASNVVDLLLRMLRSNCNDSHFTSTSRFYPASLEVMAINIEAFFVDPENTSYIYRITVNRFSPTMNKEIRDYFNAFPYSIEERGAACGVGLKIQALMSDGSWCETVRSDAAAIDYGDDIAWTWLHHPKAPRFTSEGNYITQELEGLEIEKRGI